MGNGVRSHSIHVPNFVGITLCLLPAFTHASFASTSAFTDKCPIAFPLYLSRFTWPLTEYQIMWRYSINSSGSVVMDSPSSIR